jgi:anthranilate synthase component I
MKSIKIITQSKKISSDLITPVSLFLKLRSQFVQCILLESNESGDIQNSKSIIAALPIVDIKATALAETCISIHTKIQSVLDDNPASVFKSLMQSIQTEDKLLANAFYGYFSYDSIPLFEDIAFKQTDNNIPLFQYSIYTYVFVFDHFKDTLDIYCNNLEHTTYSFQDIDQLLNAPILNENYFETIDPVTSEIDDAVFIKTIEKGIYHCQMGDVFQIVLSRHFQCSFIGDDFEVYRKLRNINPSPYLFYFDYTDFKLMGSSPEALVKVKDQKATVNPIAGTHGKTGDQEKDLLSIKRLQNDEKENAEHTMLVDLARNDLSKTGKQTTVTKYKEVHHYSHLIHLVSEVESILPKDYNGIDVFGSVFPAGTLSGAPKYRAMELIDQMEPNNRSFYGGAIGFITLDQEVNLAIMIRTILSKNYTLHLQAGAGVVAKSIPQNELEEVNIKLGALKMAIEKANMREVLDST